MISVKIGPITYEIKTVEGLLGCSGEKLDGQIKYSNPTIELDSELSFDMQRQTLLHEILHGILTHSGRHDEVSEGAIDAIAYGMFGVIRDNPEFVWLP